MKTVLLVLGVLFLVLLWYLRTWFHGIVLFVYATPILWQVLALTVILHLLVVRRIRALHQPHEISIEGAVYRLRHSQWFTPCLFVILLVPALLMAGWLRGADLAESLTYRQIDGLPESQENLRLMPYEVASRYARDSLQLSQYKLGTENIALVHDRLQWTFPLTPDGLVITFLRQNKGMVMVDASTEEKNTAHVWQDMAIGEGMQIRDNLYWNLLRRHYFVNLDDPYYLPTPDHEDIYTVVGAAGYKLRFHWGMLYTVPYFKGVFTVNTAGDIDFLSPEEARGYPILADNRIFPEHLARTFVDAHRYHLGIVNRLFIHEDQIQIQDVRTPASPVNRQPYLMDTTDGLKWFVSAEPHGLSHGIFKIFLVDAASGEIEVYPLPPEETLTGPVRSIDYVRRSNPIVDWNRFDSVEPLPFIRDGQLYWKLTVIPDDAAGIAYQVFVDAATNHVLELHSFDEVQAFLAGTLDAEEAAAPPGSGEELRQEIRQRLQEIEQLLEQL